MGGRRGLSGKRSREVNLLVVLCSACALLVSPALADPPDLLAVRERGFEVTGTDGTKTAFVDLVPAGRPAVLEFWATWCAPCRKITPVLQELFTRYGPEKLTIVGFSVEDPETATSKVDKYMSEKGVTYPVAFSPRELFQYMNEREEIGVPKILVFDAQGHVVEHITSYSPMTKRRIENAVKRAMR